MKPKRIVSKKESPDELLARRIVEHNSAVVLVLHDDGSENGMVDYRVHRSIAADGVGEHLGVLEVGTITNPEFRSSLSQHRKRHRGFDAPALTKSWRVICQFGVVFRGLEDRLTRLLHKLEEQGLENLRLVRSDPNAARFFEEIMNLPGVVEVMRIPDGSMTTQVVTTFMWSTTGNTDPDLTLEMVEQFLSSDGKDPAGIRKKVTLEPNFPYRGIYLHLDGAPELVEDSEFTEYRQFATPLEFDVMPSREPDLPHGFTDLWLVGKSGLGWHWNQDQGWTFAESPPVPEA
ncbi:hypothetical protein [Rhodococcoides fascians]|uniref:hypothetical protein n=1 Tax=Rhodococcoides fascians TaxID=1828 RepID=UPI00055A4A44|nr:hypothetical protein [Rhodococcus fascians]